MMHNHRLDHDIIFGLIEPGSRVLDLGCGDGALLFRLAREKGALVRGIECDEQAVQTCVRKGLSVLHGNIEGGLDEYPDRSFDYVIMNQTMQEVRKVDCAIQQARRIGRKVVVGFPNFAHFKSRLIMFFKGKAPVTDSLPYLWYDTPNVRFLSVEDFREFCLGKGIPMLEAHYLGQTGEIRRLPNLRALNAVFVLAGNAGAPDGMEDDEKNLS
ncbi:MAG: methionine biosynthesis protein MetW [Syntrophaceae bacterium]